MRSSQVNLKLSSYAYLNGHFFYKTPLALLGSKALVYHDNLKKHHGHRMHDMHGMLAQPYNITGATNFGYLKLTDMLHQRQQKYIMRTCAHQQFQMQTISLLWHKN